MMGKKISGETRREIEALSREGLPQKEIAGHAGICVDTVREVQKTLALQPHPHKHPRGQITAAEKRKIAKLYEKEGKLIKEIAARLSIRRDTVADIIKRAGLVPGLPERKLLALRRAGLTQPEIARKLRLNYRRVFRWFRAHGVRQPRYAMTPQKLAAIDDAILRREATAISIVNNYRASYTYTLARAHQLLECERFLGISNPPLTSYFPS